MLIRLILAGIIMTVLLDASAATRRLATNCTLPAFTPSEAQPFDLDACTINDGDDITALLTDIRSRWPGGFFVRAPSRSVSVVSNTIKWPSDTKVYMFLEDENPANHMLIQHAASPTDFWTLWGFENFDTVKIGGPNGTLTFRGNHPGLANCDVQSAVMLGLGYDAGTAAICDANKGLIEFRMTDGSLATLADVRADIKFAQQYSIYTWGSFEEGGVTNKIGQFNVSGLHYATSGVFFHQGVKNAWADLVVSDPYVRAFGWTGIAPGQAQGGLPMGCNDQTRDQVRGAGFGGYYTDSITGEVTFEYGAPNFVQRLTGHVGNSVGDPFIVRLKDWGVSGPGTGYPAGVRVKKTVEATFFKGDPHDRPGDAGPMRFVRFEKLTDTYGSGPGSDYLDGCFPSNAWFDTDSNFARLENSVTGRLNRDWHLTFVGDWDTNFVRGDLLYFAFDDARSYGHTLAAASGTTITDAIVMYDTDTVTGPGVFEDVGVSSHGPASPGRDNVIADTNVAGTVTISANTERTTIRNVDFSGPARAIISIGSLADVTVSKICAASGSTITGTGTLVYEGLVRTLPFVIDSANNCSVVGGVTPTIQASACTYTLSPTSASVAAGGATGSTTLTTGAGCTWNATGGGGWLTVSTATTGTGSTSIGWSAAANTGAQRITNLSIGGATFTATEAAATSSTPTSSTPAPIATLSASSLNFGNLKVGTTSSAKTVTLKNTGGGTLTIASLATGDANPGDFARNGTCTVNMALSGGKSCTFQYLFTPTAKGSRSATLNVSTNAGTVNVSLSGRGN